MIKKLVIMIIVSILASFLAIPKELTEPIVTAVYCKLQPDDCPAEIETK